MKKIFLGLGTVTAIVAPVAAVVSCGNKGINIQVKEPKTKGQKTYSINIELPVGITPQAPTSSEVQLALTQDASVKIHELFLTFATELAGIDHESNDNNKIAQALVDVFYSIGKVTLNYNISFNDNSTTTTSSFDVLIDFSKIIDIEKVNNIKSEKDLDTFQEGIINSVLDNIFDKMFILDDIVMDTTWTTWKKQLTNASLINIYPGKNLTPNSTTQEILALKDEILKDAREQLESQI